MTLEDCLITVNFEPLLVNWWHTIQIKLCPIFVYMNIKGMIFIEVPTKLGHIFTEQPFLILGTMVLKNKSCPKEKQLLTHSRNPKEFLTLTIFFLKKKSFLSFTGESRAELQGNGDASTAAATSLGARGSFEPSSRLVLVTSTVLWSILYSFLILSRPHYSS